MQFYEKLSKHINSDPKEQWLREYQNASHTATPSIVLQTFLLAFHSMSIHRLIHHALNTEHLLCADLPSTPDILTPHCHSRFHRCSFAKPKSNTLCHLLLLCSRVSPTQALPAMRAFLLLLRHLLGHRPAPGLCMCLSLSLDQSSTGTCLAPSLTSVISLLESRRFAGAALWHLFNPVTCPHPHPALFGRNLVCPAHS